MKSLSGRPMVVNLWASWCAPCRTEMPDIERSYQKYKDRVSFMGVTDDVMLDAARKVADETGATYPLYQDGTGEVQKALGVVTLPATAFVDADGRVVETHLGRITSERLDEELEALLARSANGERQGPTVTNG